MYFGKAEPSNGLGKDSHRFFPLFFALRDTSIPWASAGLGRAGRRDEERDRDHTKKASDNLSYVNSTLANSLPRHSYRYRLPLPHVGPTG